jgi:hypothetical protein
MGSVVAIEYVISTHFYLKPIPLFFPKRVPWLYYILKVTITTQLLTTPQALICVIYHLRHTCSNRILKSISICLLLLKNI